VSVLRARWVLPIDQRPIENGWIQIEGRGIGLLGAGRAPEPVEDLGDVAILPGLANAHTHLELSWMANRVPPQPSMDQWIRTLMSVRRGAAPDAESQRTSAVAAAKAMAATGTVLVGDVLNAPVTPHPMLMASMRGVQFYELIGFNIADPRTRVEAAWDEAERILSDELESFEPYPEFSIVAHAPYSVSPALFKEIVSHVRRDGRHPLEIHLAESLEELEFLRTGRGPIRDMLESLGVWTDTWRVPGCGPVEYIDSLGYLRPGTLVVHAVHVTDAELARLREARAVVVTCPRSNSWVGAGPPPLDRFFAAGVRVAIGTDSLASAPTLNLFDEMAEIHRLAPRVSPARILDSATRVGAEALRQGHVLGTLTVGKLGELVVVNLPSGVTDVEEYLVSGVAPQDVRVIRSF
jgi:cytosine/adenosine deaminase-related metal-dependent hydrolase